MAEEIVDRQIKLPGDKVITVRVPQTWGADQIKAALQERGVLPPPDQVEQMAGTMSLPEKAGKVVADTFSPSGVVEVGKRVWNNFIYEGDEIQRLLKEAATGETSAGEDISGPMRAGKGAFGLLRMVGLPITPFIQEAGKGIEDAATLFSGSRKVGRVVGMSTEVGLAFMSGSAGQRLAQQVALSSTDPVAARTLLMAESIGPGATTAVLARQLARKEGVDPKKVDETIKVLGERMDPAIKATLDPARKARTGKLPRDAGTETVINKETMAQVTKGAEDALAGNFDKSRRVFAQIADKLQAGEIDAMNIPAVLKKYGMTQKQFAQEYAYAVSTAGHVLQQHSRVAKSLRAALDDVEAQTILFAIRKDNPHLFDESAFDKFMRMYVSVENFRRGLIVTQLGTAMRNVVAGGAHYSLAVMENVLVDFVRATGKMAKGDPKAAVADMLTSVNAFVRTGVKLKIENRKELLRLLDDPNSMGPIYHMRLVSNVMGDVNLSSKVAYYANTFNRVQEFLVRGTAMEFKMRQLTQRHLGKNLETLNGADIPQDVWEESLRFAMRATFAETPRSKFMREIVKAWTNIPGLTTINPFPRFAFGNAIPFVLNRSPLGVFRMLGQTQRKGLMKLLNKEKLDATESEELSRVMSETTTGMGLLWSAWHLRQSEHAGEKWYELKTQDGRTVDTRSYAPFSTYLLVAEAMVNPDRLKWQDWGEAFVGVSRVAGTGAFLFDVMRAKNAETGWQQFETFAGKYIGSFSVPVRQFRDLMDFDMRPADAILRDTRQDPVLGPFIDNLPLMRDTLPEKYSPLQAGKVNIAEPLHEFEFMGRKHMISTPVWRQLTGVSMRTKNMLQREVDRLQIDPANIYSRTGIPEADNLVAKAQGYFMANIAPTVAERVKGQPEAVQRLAWRRTFTASKAYGRAMLQAQFPRLANEVKALKQDEDELQIMQEFGGVNPYMALDEELAARGYQAPGKSRLPQ